TSDPERGFRLGMPRIPFCRSMSTSAELGKLIMKMDFLDLEKVNENGCCRLAYYAVPSVRPRVPSYPPWSKAAHSFSLSDAGTAPVLTKRSQIRAAIPKLG